MRYILGILLILILSMQNSLFAWERGTGFNDGELQMNNFPITNVKHILIREVSSDPDVTDSDVAILFLKAATGDLCIRWDNHDTEVIETHP